MNITELYQTAVAYAEALRKEKPNYSAGGDSLCVMRAENGDVFAGMTSAAMRNGVVAPVPAEMMALVAMRSMGVKRVTEMLTIGLSDNRIETPDSMYVKLLMDTDPDNGTCEIAISEDEAVPAASLMDSNDFFDGFDDAPAPAAPAPELAAPADFAAGFQVDVNNPFYAPPADEQVPAPENVLANRTPAPSAPAPAAAAPAPGENAAPRQEQDISKDDLLKEAKQRKKAVKAIFNFKKKF